MFFKKIWFSIFGSYSLDRKEFLGYIRPYADMIRKKENPKPLKKSPLERQIEHCFAQWILNTLNNVVYGQAFSMDMLQEFLKNCWTISAHESVGIFAQPHSSTTECLIKIAEYIRSKTGASLVSLLMPGVHQIALSEEYSDLEDLDIHHILTHYIVGENGSYLIPVSILKEITVTAPIGEERLPNMYYDFTNPLHTHHEYLSKGEILRLYWHNDHHKNLMTLKKQRFLLQDKDRSLLTQIELVIATLEWNSRGQMGTEHDLSESGYAVFESLSRYLDLLSIDQKKRIPADVLQAMNEVFLMASSKELNTFAKDRSRACAYTLQQNLKHSLTQKHCEILSSITVDASEFRVFCEAETEFALKDKELREYLKDLKNRHLSVHGRDPALFSISLLQLIGYRISFAFDQDLDQLLPLSPSQMEIILDNQILRDDIFDIISDLNNFSLICQQLYSAQLKVFLKAYSNHFYQLFPSSNLLIGFLGQQSAQHLPIFLEALEARIASFCEKNPSFFREILRSISALSPAHKKHVRDYWIVEGNALFWSRHIHSVLPHEREEQIKFLQKKNIVARWATHFEDSLTIAQACLHKKEFNRLLWDLFSQGLENQMLFNASYCFHHFQAILSLLPHELLERYLASLKKPPKLKIPSSKSIAFVEQIIAKSSTKNCSITKAQHKSFFSKIFLVSEDYGQASWTQNKNIFIANINYLDKRQRMLCLEQMFLSKKMLEWSTGLEEGVMLLGLATQNDLQCLEEPQILEAMTNVLKRTLSHAVSGQDLIKISLACRYQSLYPADSENEGVLQKHFIEMLCSDSVLIAQLETPLQMETLLFTIYYDLKKTLLKHLCLNNTLAFWVAKRPNYYKVVTQCFLNLYGESDRYCLDLSVDRNAEVLKELADKHGCTIILEFLARSETFPFIDLNNRKDAALLFKACSPKVLDCIMQQSYISAGFICFDGDDINRQDQNGNTLLHHAVLKNNIDLVYVLLRDYKADRTIMNLKGQKPEDLCHLPAMKAVFSDTEKKNRVYRTVCF